MINDTLLIKVSLKARSVIPAQIPVSRRQTAAALDFMYTLQELIHQGERRKCPRTLIPQACSKGINKIAQKVGEEAVELVIEAKDKNDDLFLNEAADLVYHLMVLLSSQGFQHQGCRSGPGTTT